MQLSQLEELMDKDELFLDECENNLNEAKKAFQAAQQEASLATQKFQAAQIELNIWTGAVNTVKARLEKKRQELEQDKQRDGSPEKPSGMSASSGLALQSVPESTGAAIPDLNKTEMIRTVLRRHPSGMTPSELWKELDGQVSRDYVYAVLKRLKDREQIAYRRKKYSLKDIPAPKQMGGHAPATLQ
jgi:DNA repair exonuclease SbcCD ATPase subunit